MAIRFDGLFPNDGNEYVPYGRLLEFLASCVFVGIIFAVLYFG